MSERLPYEELLKKRLNDLPLPDEDMAWADMKRRLEEEDDDPIVFWWRKGCLLWGILLIAFLAGGIWLLQKNNWFNKKEVESTIVNQESPTPTIKKENRGTTVIKNSEEKKEFKKTDTSISQIIADSINVSINTKERREKTTTVKTPEKGVDVKLSKPSNLKPRKNDPLNSLNEKKTKTPAIKKNDVVRETESKIPEQEIVIKLSADKAEKDVIQILPDSSKVDTVISTNKTASQTVSTEKKDSSLVRDTSTAKKKENVYFFSGGLGLHQQLPIAGQKLTPYNSLGRKGSLADYIPSLYFRYNKKDKWFVQAELRYGAPQYTKEITYKQSIVPEPGPNPIGSSISSYSVKKTYYHQLPITFNYMIIPNWSTGVGIQFNSLYGLVAELSTGRRINLTQTDTLFTKTIVQVKKDTVNEFKKSYLLGVAETQYQWKKFSIGAKYSFGLQPYIQFQLPGGTPQKEKSHAIQVFLRYQLWKSKEK